MILNSPGSITGALRLGFCLAESGLNRAIGCTRLIANLVPLPVADWTDGPEVFARSFAFGAGSVWRVQGFRIFFIRPIEENPNKVIFHRFLSVAFY